jgi:hypothetical protein
MIIVQYCRSGSPFVQSERDWFVSLSRLSRLFAELTRTHLFEELYVSLSGRRKRQPKFIRLQKEVAEGHTRAVYLSGLVLKLTFVRWRPDNANSWHEASKWLDGHMRWIQTLPALRDLYMDRCELAESFFASLSRLATLRILSLNSCEISLAELPTCFVSQGTVSLPPRLDDFYSDVISLVGPDEVAEPSLMPLVSSLAKSPLTKLVLEDPMMMDMFNCCGFQSLEILALDLPYGWNQERANAAATFLSSLPNLTTLKVAATDYSECDPSLHITLPLGSLPHLTDLECPLCFAFGIMEGRRVRILRLETFPSSLSDFNVIVVSALFSTTPKMY